MIWLTGARKDSMELDAVSPNNREERASPTVCGLVTYLRAILCVGQGDACSSCPDYNKQESTSAAALIKSNDAARASSPNCIRLTLPTDSIQTMRESLHLLSFFHLPSLTTVFIRQISSSSTYCIMADPATTSDTYSRVWSIPHIRDAIITFATLKTCTALSLVNKDISDQARKQIQRLQYWRMEEYWRGRRVSTSFSLEQLVSTSFIQLQQQLPEDTIRWVTLTEKARERAREEFAKVWKDWNPGRY